MADVLQVDHLTPEGGGREFWKCLLNDDIQNVSVKQIQPVTIDSDWIQAASSRRIVFQVNNWREVDEMFSSYF